MNAAQTYASQPHHAYLNHAHPQTPVSGAPYPQYQQPAPFQPGINGYSSGHGQYHLPYGNSATPALHHPQYPHQAQTTHLPVMAPATSTPTASDGHSYSLRTPDTTGQVAPPGVRPKITATLWEDEGTLCFQVEINGICVARREDNHMVNGTKLLNVAQMTRGRRDGILKSEKIRNVVKVGPMHLKGVWIPFERAIDFANKENITERLYPLFVYNVGALLHQPQARTVSSRRGDSQSQAYLRTSQTSQPPASQSYHAVANPISAPASQPTHSVAPNAPAGRPAYDRAQTFPTPPTSATSMIGQGNSGSSYEWGGASAAIDNGINHARSMPTTPATTPPEHSLQHMQQYQSSQPFDSSRQGYSVSTTQQFHGKDMAHQSIVHYRQTMHPHGYVKGEMAPPSRDLKEEDCENKEDYAQPGNYNGERGYNYNSHPSTVQVDHSYHSPDIKNSPTHNPGSGRATPRTTVATPQNQWQAGYSTPQRNQALPSSNLSYVISDTRNNGTNGIAIPQPYSHTNGTTPSKKRGRDVDDEEQDSYIQSSHQADLDTPKRRKIVREGSTINKPSATQRH